MQLINRAKLLVSKIQLQWIESIVLFSVCGAVTNFALKVEITMRRGVILCNVMQLTL